jgi:hypothetical protein
MDINSTHPTVISHEGYTFLEFNGEFYKGCPRCGGEGQYSFNGEHSRCYDCNNTSSKLGVHFDSRADAEKWCHGKAVAQANRDRLRENKRLALVAKMESYQEAVKEADEEVYSFLEAIHESEEPTKDTFIANMVDALFCVSYAKPFTPKMIAAVRKNLDRAAEQEAASAAHPAPTGRVVVTGEITSTKVVEGDYGMSFKIIVKDDAGFKVWCTIPRALMDDLTGGFSEVKGRRITFTATLEASRDDVAFAFGKRPTKGAWL